MLLKCIGAAVLAASMLTATMGQALTTIDLDDDVRAFRDGRVNPGDIVGNDGLRIRFGNMTLSNGAAAASGGVVDTDGIFFSRDTRFQEVVRLNMRFSERMRIIGYDIDFVRVLRRHAFWIVGPDGQRTGNNPIPPRDVGRLPFDMGNISEFQPGVAYQLRHNVPETYTFPNAPAASPFFQIDEIDVAPVPLPGTGVLLGSALLAGAAYATRRRKEAR